MLKFYIAKILNKKGRHAEQAYKVCLGILNLSTKVGNQRLTKACQRALEYSIYNYKTIKKILDNGLEKQEGEENDDFKMPKHDNIRGKDYYK